MADITEHEAEQIDAANDVRQDPGRVRARAVAAPEQLGPLADGLRGAGYATRRPGWPDDPTPSRRRTPTPRCSPHKSVGQIADHFEDVIGKLDAKPASSATRSAGCSRRSSPAAGCRPRRSRSIRHRSVACCRCRSPRSSRRRRCCGNPANHRRAVPLTYEQFRYAFANAVDRGRGQGAVRDLRRARLRRAAVPGRRRQPQPVDRSEGRSEEPRPRPDAHHLGRARPHRALGDRQRVLQEAEAQRGRHRDRRDPRRRGTRS